jgi:acetyltransferase-like isoleucine patch superfamily enzyme
MLYELGYKTGVFFYGRLLNAIGKRVSRLVAGFFSGWMAAQLQSVGNNFSIQAPCYLTGSRYIRVGNDFSSGKRLRLEAIFEHHNVLYSPEIIIGNNVRMEEDCHIGCIHKIEIGNNVLIAGKACIIDHFHGKTDCASLLTAPRERPLFSKGEVKIGHNVWIGEGVTILPGVTIGDNSIIGAGAVVTKSFPDHSIVVGNPAKLQKRIER